MEQFIGSRGEEAVIDNGHADGDVALEGDDIRDKVHRDDSRILQGEHPGDEKRALIDTDKIDKVEKDHGAAPQNERESALDHRDMTQEEPKNQIPCGKQHHEIDGAAEDVDKEKEARKEVVKWENEPKCALSNEASVDANTGKGVQFSRPSTSDSDLLTKLNNKVVKTSMGVPSGTINCNPEIPSSSWTFSTRASIAPSKFDHKAVLKMNYSIHKQGNDGKEGVPLSLVPEILESARFMVPPPRELVPLLQRLDTEYKSGDLIRWSLLQNLALQIEHKEARYPSVFNPRSSVARTSSMSPSSWKASQRSPSRRTHPEDEWPELEPQVYEMMKEIDNHRRKSAKEGKYLAADAAAQRLLEVKLFEDNKRRATMLEKHAQEREQVEKAYKEELQERNQQWDERLKNFQKEVLDHAQRLKQQHILALQQFKKRMSSKTPVKTQWSRELLKQRRIQAYLGRQGKYLEAQEIKQSADRMEQAELQATMAAFQAEVVAKEQAMRGKQQTEMDILLQRAARTREEIRKSRTADLQRCHQRHKNVMRELAALQKQEVFRFDQLMQKKVQNPYSGVAWTQRAAQSPLSRLQVNVPDCSGDDAIYTRGDDKA